MKRTKLPIYKKYVVQTKDINHSENGKLDYKNDCFQWTYVDNFVFGNCEICGESLINQPGWYSITRDQQAHKKCVVDYTKI